MFHYLLVPYRKAIWLFRFESEKRGSKLGLWYSSKTMSTSLCWVKLYFVIFCPCEWTSNDIVGYNGGRMMAMLQRDLMRSSMVLETRSRSRRAWRWPRRTCRLDVVFLFCHIIISYKQVLGSTGTKPDHLYTCALSLKQKSWETDSFRDGLMVISWSNPLNNPHKGSNLVKLWKIGRQNYRVRNLYMFVCTC